MKKRYDSKRITISPEEIVKLSERARLKLLFYMQGLFEAFSQRFSDAAGQEHEILWAWVALAAYRAGRLSMWRDCRERQRDRMAAR